MQETQETCVQSLGQEDLPEEEMQPTLVILPGESHGQRSLVGYSPQSGKGSDTTEHMHARTRAHARTHTHTQYKIPPIRSLHTILRTVPSVGDANMSMIAQLTVWSSSSSPSSTTQ